MISTNYILRGQDTLYLQKFNVTTNGRYGHQYMQNIMAPASEAPNIKKAYSNTGALNNSFVFKIPVYNNMPASACSKPDTTDAITLNKTAIKDLAVGRTEKVIPYVNGSKVDSLSVLTFASDHTDVATVDAQGVIRAVSPGTATITCSRSGASGASCTVTVVKAEPDADTPVLSPVVYKTGLRLSDIALPEGWRWSSADTLLHAGTSSYQAVYTPEDTTRYLTVTRQIGLKISQAIPRCNMPEKLSAKLGSKLGSIALPQGFAWESDGETVLDQAGEKTFFLSYDPNDPDYLALDHIPVVVKVTDDSVAPEESDDYDGPLPGDGNGGGSGSGSGTGGGSGNGSGTGGGSGSGSGTGGGSGNGSGTGGGSGNGSGTGSQSGGSTTSQSSTNTGSSTTSQNSTSTGSSTTSGSSTSTNSSATSQNSTGTGSSAPGFDGPGIEEPSGGHENNGTGKDNDTTSGSSTSTSGSTTSQSSTSTGSSTTSQSSTSTGSSTTSQNSTGTGSSAPGIEELSGGNENNGTGKDHDTTSGSSTSTGSSTTSQNSTSTSTSAASQDSTGTGGGTTGQSSTSTGSSVTSQGSTVAGGGTTGQNSTGTDGNAAGGQRTTVGSNNDALLANADIAAEEQRPETVYERPSVTMDMEDVSILTDEMLQMAKEQNVDLILRMNDRAVWRVDAGSVQGSFADIDMSVVFARGIIPQDLLERLADGNDYLEFSLAHEGMFGFDTELEILLDPKDCGRYANLFYYDPEAGTLEFICASIIDENGYAVFDMEHASDYVIIISDSPMSAVSPAKDADSAGPIWPKLLIAAAVAAVLAALAAGGFLFLKARRNDEEEDAADDEEEDESDGQELEMLDADRMEERSDAETAPPAEPTASGLSEEDRKPEKTEEPAQAEETQDAEDDWIEDADWHEPERPAETDPYADDHAENDWIDDDEWDISNDWIDDDEWERRKHQETTA